MNRIANITHKLFYDNKVLMVFSFVVAVIIWLLVVISFSPVDTAVIKDVPVTLDLANSVPAQFDLEIFGQSEFSVDVEVSGKRYILSSVADKNSVKVVAQTAYVDSAGKHTLTLKASKVKESDEFEIVGLSDEFIEVFFDVYMEQDFNLEPRINADDELVEKGFVAGDPVLSAESVVISGPATEVRAVKSVFAEINIDKPLSQTKTQAAEINAYNEAGAVLHYLSYNYGNSDVTVTVPVYYVVNKPTSVTFKNAPSAYIDEPFSYTINPAQFNAGIQGIDGSNTVESIAIATIDFAQLKPGKNVFTVSADSVPSVYSLESFNDFEVTVSVTGCKSKTLTVPAENISFVNAPQSYNVESVVRSVGSVTVVGPEASLSVVTPSELFATVDLSGADLSATQQEFSARVSVKNSEDCWVSGSYSVVVSQ
ncbi:MAG: hypothetical protein IJE14_01350 [Clostridia bacterium]|nr:hypothetical protein [Clostridia bacterium]MBQ6931029.1 hypothetical protein [Clostridia bacterium]